MSTDTTEYNDDRDVPSLPCPVCIEAASEKVGEKELVPEQLYKDILSLNSLLI